MATGIRIGDTLRPELGRIDYSGLAELYLQQGQQMGANIARGIDAIGGAIVQGRKDEAKVKADAKLIEEAKKYLPDNGYLNDIHAAITSKDTPLREKLALGQSVAPLIELGIARMDADRDYKLRDRQVTVSEEGAKTDRRRVDIAEAQYQAETAASNATAADKNAQALTAAVSTMQPLDDLLAAHGKSDESEARKRVDKLISAGRGAEALTAAKEWADAARSELNKGLTGGWKLDKIGVTTPDGLPGEMDVMVAPDGGIVDLQGNVIWSPTGPASQNARPTRSMPAAAESYLQSPQSSAPTKAGDFLPSAPPPNAIDAALAQGQPARRTAPAGIEAWANFAASAGQPPAQPPAPPGFTVSPALLDAYGAVNGVLPNKDGGYGAVPVPGQRYVAPPRVGIRRMVSPKETPQETLQKSRQAAGDARLAETLKESQTLAATLPNLEQTKALLDEVRTGFGAEAVTKAKRLLGQDVANAEQLQTLLGDQVMARVGQTKGAVSEKEMELFQQFSANFGKTNEGNRKIVDFAMKAAERAKKIQTAINDGFRTGKDPFTIEQEVQAIREANPITDALQGPATTAPAGIPQDEKDENAFFNTKPSR